MTELLVIDVTAVIVSAISGFFSIISLVITILVNKNQNTIKKQMNGMKSELVEAVRGEAQAIGELKGAADNQAATDAKPQSKK